MQVMTGSSSFRLLTTSDVGIGYYLRSEVDQYLFLRVLYSLPYPCTASILWRVF